MTLISNRMFKEHSEKSKEDNDLEKDFIQLCWRIKTQVDSDFKDLIKGYRNSQEKFMLKCLEESMQDKRELKSLDEIKSLKESLYDRNAEIIESISKINFDHMLEENPSFKMKIIGKEDVDLADLITKLQISDWVKDGYVITKDSEGICPFCQQSLPELFEMKLLSYFDQAYEQQIKILDDASRKYIDHYKVVMLQIDGILSYDKNSSFLDKEKIHNIVKLIQSKYEENKLLIDQKKKEPSRSIELVKIYKLIEDLNVEISDSNKSIREFNKIIENSSLEKENLMNRYLSYIVELNSNNLKDYKRKKEILEKKLQGLKNNISKKERYKREFELEMIRYQQQITSVEHSVNEINTLLSSFGFKNFKLAAALEEGNYKIIRENGEDAKETLSEGETTFITFLYFYQLLKGSNNISEIAKEKVVVIDDPISSLDSSVLFMVSSMVRKLMFDIKENKSEIKQIFVLTHNIYFHKEVTFNQGKKSFGDGSYWILRKNNNLTSIQQYSDNPDKNVL